MREEPLDQAESDAPSIAMLGTLNAIEANAQLTQRSLASQLGIALGLANAYLKRCTKKGLVKIRAVPARRYSYYLTPKGFAEKSRLTVEYLARSLSFFRHAREDCMATFRQARAQGWRRVVLVGISDLAEISVICALESGVSIVAVVDANSEKARLAGLPVIRSFAEIADDVDGAIVTDSASMRSAYEMAVAHLGARRVTAPALLGLGLGPIEGGSAAVDAFEYGAE
jgi:DNA-binding MarR family transcriptional regulator